jgi:poly-gamma-glutamate capsule biosynthesis protein CapA/YwtB (metallophosphatase superfamily)
MLPLRTESDNRTFTKHAIKRPLREKRFCPLANPESQDFGKFGRLELGMGLPRSPRLLAATVASIIALSTCAAGVEDPAGLTAARPVRIIVVNETGEPVHGATIMSSEWDVQTDVAGEALISISEPITAIVSAKGALDEPVAIGADDLSTAVRLWDRVGPDGTERSSMHFGGDVMLGRRYLETDRVDTPIVTDAASARDIVSDLAPLSATADWTVVNLESVIGELPATEAYAGKRFLLQSTPLITETLDELGVDLVTLGNNHAYDWRDPGIESTLEALDAAGITHVGAGSNPDDAVRGQIVEVGEGTIGIVSYTTVNGSFVNDQSPSNDERAPADLPTTERWQYSKRPFSYSSPGDPLYIAEAERRIGEIWSLFTALEDEFGDDKVADLWSALIAVYPELQDWVARRGHGGAAPYGRTEMENEVTRLEQSGAEMIVVQIHGGFQFAEVKSEFVQQIAHAAVDAGADLVVAHHPHVLQGVEWYKDKLVVYSLGNLVFDQDFLETFPSAILRVITEGPDILEARMIPLVLDRYRPVPVTGLTATQIVRKIDQRSAQPAVATRGAALEVITEISEIAPSTAAVVDSASLRLERNSGVIVKGRRWRQETVEMDLDGESTLAACSIVRSDLLGETIELGVDLYGWGRFDDDTADGEHSVPSHWALPTDSDNWKRSAGRTLNPLDDSIELITNVSGTTTMRLLARVDISEHRLFESVGNPVDQEPLMEIRLDAKRSRGEAPSLRFVTFHFQDSDPTSSPETSRLREINVPIEVPPDGVWHSIVIPLPDDLLSADINGNRANTATLLIDAPPAWNGRLAVDNVRIIQWRGVTSTQSPTWVAADLVRSSQDPVQLTTSGC